MKLRNVFLVVAVVLLTSFLSVKAQKIGDVAPNLHILKWLKGKSVPSFEKGKVYVIEFTFVSCIPCREAIPHLSDIARRYRETGKVEVISIFTSESNPKRPADLRFVKPIESMVKRMGDKMDYTIAVDVPEQKTRVLWGNIYAFPSVFIVNQEGTIAYIGHSDFSETNFALESIVKTGKYEQELYLKTEGAQKRINNARLWEGFNQELDLLTQRGDYVGKISKLDSALTDAPLEKVETLLLSKFETYLLMGDSTKADKILQEVLVNKKSGWETLHGFFYRLSFGKYHLPFNFNHYLTIADHAFKEVEIPTMQSSILVQKANVIYNYSKSKEKALEVLNEALTLVKRNGFVEKINDVESQISYLNQKDDKRKQADADWQFLIDYNLSPEEIEKSESEKGNIGYQELMSQYAKMRTDLAGKFWEKYPSDIRRFGALQIFMKANFVFVPWIGDISKERLTETLTNYKILKDGYQKNPELNLSYYVAPYFRMFPRDLEAESEWVKKGNNMVKHMMSGTTNIVEREALEWEVFVRDWRTAANRALYLPSHNERPDDNIVRLEGDFWKSVSPIYWESFWIRINQHIEKYADLEVIANRAASFLSGTQLHDPDLVISYWQRMIDKYGDTEYPLNHRKGVQALYKRAIAQLNIAKIEEQQVPVDMKFTALDGREIDISHYRGKIVLIDFWASWCKPCIGEMPKLKSVYDKYHDKGFEMIGICLDEESKREEVKQLLAKNSLIGPQRFEGKGFDGDSYKQLYGLKALPTVWLIDKNGMLVSTNARGKELDRLLEKYLGPDKL